MQGLGKLAAVDVQQMSAESFCREIFCVRKMDASVR